MSSVTSPPRRVIFKNSLECEGHKKESFPLLTIALLSRINCGRGQLLVVSGAVTSPASWQPGRSRPDRSRSSKTSERVNHGGLSVRYNQAKSPQREVKDMIEHGEINYCNVVFENQLRCWGIESLRLIIVIGTIAFAPFTRRRRSGLKHASDVTQT